MRSRKAQSRPSSAEAGDEPKRVVDANHVVAFNFRAARELRGWTQDETAVRLAPYLGHQLPKASISAIERSSDSDRRRQFDAQELVAFSLAFQLPIVWFLLPPPWLADATLEGTERPVTFLVRLLLGTDAQQDHIQERLEAIRAAGDRSGDDVLADAFALPPELSWAHFQRARQEALLALVEEESSEIERLLGELRRVTSKFEDFSLKAYMAAHPRRVYRAISDSILGERVFQAIVRSEGDDDPRYHRVMTALTQGGRAIEDAVDLDDPVLVERLEAVFDRVEERLRTRPGTPEDGSRA